MIKQIITKLLSIKSGQLNWLYKIMLSGMVVGATWAKKGGYGTNLTNSNDIFLVHKYATSNN